MIEHLTQPSPAELDALTALWEASVRATHDFLSEGGHPLLPADGSQRSTCGRTTCMSYGTPTTGQTGPAGLAGQTGQTGRTGTGIDRGKPNGRNRTRQPGKRVRRVHRLAGVAGDMLEMLFVDPRGAGQGIRPATREPRHTALRRAAGRRQRAEPAGRGFLRTDRDSAPPGATRPTRRAGPTPSCIWNSDTPRTQGSYRFRAC